MKSTGIVRRIDELGRIVLPVELRRVLNIKEGDQIEIFRDSSDIVLRKYQPIDEIEATLDTLERQISDADPHPQQLKAAQHAISILKSLYKDNCMDS